MNLGTHGHGKGYSQMVTHPETNRAQQGRDLIIYKPGASYVSWAGEKCLI